MQAKIAKELADRAQLTIEQWLAAGQHDVLHSERSYRFTMPFEIGSMELASVLSLPDIAHHTAAIALTVDTEQQNGKRGDPRALRSRPIFAPTIRRQSCITGWGH